MQYRAEKTHHRIRRPLARTLPGLILAIAVAGAAFPPGAAAQPFGDPGPESGPGQRPMSGQHRGGHPPMAIAPEAVMLRGLARATQRLDLEPDQQAEIEAILDEAREQMRANREAARGLHGELRAIVTADDFDEEALAEAAGREGQLSAERIMIAGSASAAILATLDDAQRAELELMHEAARERMRERWGSRSG
jgi:Spy/CpxP family protein refolding chaperone